MTKKDGHIHHDKMIQLLIHNITEWPLLLNTNLLYCKNKANNFFP